MSQHPPELAAKLVVGASPGWTTPALARRLDDFIGRQIIERQSGDRWVGARLIAELLAQGVQLANANQRSPLKYPLNGRLTVRLAKSVIQTEKAPSIPPWN